MARKRSKLDLMITAIHEAGHAVAAYQLGYMPTLVTIRARGENRGCTHYRRVRIHPNEDATSQRRKVEHAIMIAYAGLISPNAVFGPMASAMAIRNRGLPA